MVKRAQISIICIGLLFLISVSGAVLKSSMKTCVKNSDCADEQQCVIDKCRDACFKHPCASNAVCKVSDLLY